MVQETFSNKAEILAILLILLPAYLDTKYEGYRMKDEYRGFWQYCLYFFAYLDTKYEGYRMKDEYRGFLTILLILLPAYLDTR